MLLECKRNAITFELFIGGECKAIKGVLIH